jgi:hypothetical protein
VTDVFCDVLIANECAIDFYGPPASLLAAAAATIGGFNQIHYVFHRDSNFREISTADDWDRLAMINVRHFRRRTLRFRSKPYYSALMRQFLNTKTYPYFERCWRRIVYEINDDYALPGAAPPGAADDRTFMETESLVALTPYGELYMHQLLPLNKPTSRRMEASLRRVGMGYREFAQLPDPRKD